MKVDWRGEEEWAVGKGASRGVLGTNDMPRLYIERGDRNAFLELMIETTDDDNEE